MTFFIAIEIGFSCKKLFMRHLCSSCFDYLEIFIFFLQIIQTHIFVSQGRIKGVARKMWSVIAITFCPEAMLLIHGKSFTTILTFFIQRNMHFFQLCSATSNFLQAIFHQVFLFTKAFAYNNNERNDGKRFLILKESVWAISWGCAKHIRWRLPFVSYNHSQK